MTLTNASLTRTPDREARERLIRDVLVALEQRGCLFGGRVHPEHQRLAWELDRIEAGLPHLRRVA